MGKREDLSYEEQSCCFIFEPIDVETRRKNHQCCICLDDFPTVKMVRLLCESNVPHTTCRKCSKNLKDYKAKTCPLCRGKFQKTELLPLSQREEEVEVVLQLEREIPKLRGAARKALQAVHPLQSLEQKERKVINALCRRQLFDQWQKRIAPFAYGGMLAAAFFAWRGTISWSGFSLGAGLIASLLANVSKK